MKPASERPFEASRFAWRTDTDGLTVLNQAAEARFENVKESYKKALQEFELEDKRARKRYHEHEEDGRTTDTFGNWVMQNDPVWHSLKAEAQSQGAALTAAGAAAFGQAYMEKHGQEESKMNREGYDAGFYYEAF